MRLNQTEKVLAICASLTVIVGGSLGIYQMFDRMETRSEAPASPDATLIAGQPKTATPESQLPDSTPKTVTPDRPTPHIPLPNAPLPEQTLPEPMLENNPVPPPEIKEQPVPETPVAEKPVPVPAHKPFYFEDFSEVKEGLLPKGWKGDDAVLVMQTGGRPHLKVNGNELSSVTVQEIFPFGDFFIEWEASNGQALQDMNLILLGSQGEELTVSTWHSGGGHDWLFVALNGSKREQVDPAISIGKSARFRLEREGEVLRLLVNGKPMHVQRMKTYVQYSGIRFELPGASGTKVYSLKVDKL